MVKKKAEKKPRKVAKADPAVKTSTEKKTTQFTGHRTLSGIRK